VKTLQYTDGAPQVEHVISRHALSAEKTKVPVVYAHVNTDNDNI